MDNKTLPLGTVADSGSGGSAGPSGHDGTGKTLGDFHLLRLLGQGGMGQVYLAEQVSLKRKVAIKLLRGDLAANATALQRFQAEALAVARVTHANIVQVYAVGEAAGLHFMALEYVEGKNLREYLERKGPPDVLISISILRQVAAALQRAGELGIVHRDIKPENILVTRKGEVKVADFGLSRIFAEDCQPLNLTATGVTMGTPLYMSPEQVEGKPVDPRTDIYSLGVTAYYLLTGEPPFRGASPFEVALQHVQNEPVPLLEIRPDLPPELGVIVHKMLAKRPEARYQTAQDIVRDLGRLRDVLVGVSSTLASLDLESSSGSHAAVSQATVLQPLVSPIRHVSGLPLAAITFVFLLLGGFGLGWLFYRGGREPTPVNHGSVPATSLQPASAPDPGKATEEHLLWDYRRLGSSHLDQDRLREFAAAVDLALFYLDHLQLEKAEQFFKDLEIRDGQYKYLGKLGKAMVLSVRDEPQKSNKLFHPLLIRKPAAKKERTNVARLPILGNHHLWERTARCLQRNYDNDPKGFPPELHRFRQPPPPVLHEKKDSKNT